MPNFAGCNFRQAAAFAEAQGERVVANIGERRYKSDPGDSTGALVGTEAGPVADDNGKDKAADKLKDGILADFLQPSHPELRASPFSSDYFRPTYRLLIDTTVLGPLVTAK